MGTVKRLAALIGLWAIGLLAVGLTPYVWSHETGPMRVAWLTLVVCTLMGSALLTYGEVRLRRMSKPDAGR